jgi:hypothetical protein
MAHTNYLRRVRICLGLFIIGLVLSGITASPLQTELDWLVPILHGSVLRSPAESTQLLPWVTRVNEAVEVTNTRFPFLAYGTDWLAFAHRNKWIITFGLISCASVIPLALIAGHIRGIPLTWRLIDCSFGVFGAMPLLLCRRWSIALERDAP